MTIASFARQLLSAVALAAVACSAPAQSWPQKPVRIIVPYPAGGTSDILARTLSVKLSEMWGQTVVVENRPGANGNVGAEMVAKSPADGYTVLLADVGAIAISPSVYTTLGFDPNKDFSPVTMVAYSPHILAVNPNVPVKSVKELIDFSKAQKGKLNYAASSVGSAPHLAGIDFANRTGTQWAYIPYKGGAQAITDVVGGQADVLFNGMLATYPHVKSGKLRILAVSSASRVPAIPDVPTVAESGVAGFETGSWQGVLAPPNTPRPIVTKINADLIKVLEDTETREKLAAQGALVRTQTPEQMTTFIRDETARWAKVVKDAGVKVE
ncbi:MAG TPA: tripartite tricarboxylate transporter substrate binding protein [Casimicrobiaceae bacterium]|nr:tripartite tricarboxylate transporter substrate binding protein [Casimicrobiaceae bacterium]